MSIKLLCFLLTEFPPSLKDYFNVSRMASQPVAFDFVSGVDKVNQKLFFERFFKSDTSLKETRGLRAGQHHRGKCRFCEKEVNQFEAYAQFRAHISTKHVKEEVSSNAVLGENLLWINV